MSIKGKGRSKGRTVAKAPRRAPVPVPVPFFRRRWVQVTAALVVGFLTFWLITWIADGLERTRLDEQRAEQAAILETWKAHIETEIGDVGQFRDPLPPAIAPQVRQAATDLLESKDPSTDAEGLESYAKDLEKATKAIEDYALSEAVRDQGFGKGASEILTARTEMVLALRTYRSAARVMAVALEADDRETAEALAERATELLDTADALMQNAYNSYTIALNDAGIATVREQPGGLSGLTP